MPEARVASPVRLVSPGASVGVVPAPALSVYVHLPWCLRKCPYCDFNSHEWRAGGAPPEREYLDALQADLEASLPLVWGRTVQTVFIGGGTPSLFSPEAIDRLLQMLRSHLRLAADAEITLEANPGTFEAGRFRAFSQAGVNRLSIGVQSFDDAALRALGRVHDSHQARAAIDTAAQCFASFNIDLMYALPGQDLEALERDLASALAFDPPHLSYYQLTLEPGTAFGRRPPVLPDDDTAARMQATIEQASAERGLAHYEISAYARAGHRARHNLNYWQFGDYLGLGAGAHGKLSFHDRIERQARWLAPRRYMQTALAGDAIESRRPVTAAELPFEFMLNALRLIEGVPATLFQERTGLTLASIARTLEAASRRGLLVDDPTALRATPLGLSFLNDLQAMFL